MSNINEIPQGSWWYGYINLNTKNFDFFMKIISPWPWPQGHPRGGDGADKNLRPISTIMPNMNEIHQRIFKIWGLINFNAKTLTLWRKDRTNERMNEQTYVRINVRTNERTEKRKLYTPTYFVCRGYKNTLCCVANPCDYLIQFTEFLYINRLNSGKVFPLYFGYYSAPWYELYSKVLC